MCVRCVYHVVDLWFFNDQISSRATFHRSPSYAFSPPSPLLFLFFPLSLPLSLLSASPLASSSISLLFLFPRVSAGQPLLPLSLNRRPSFPPLLILLSWPPGKVLRLIVHRPVEHARFHDWFLWFTTFPSWFSSANFSTVLQRCALH